MTPRKTILSINPDAPTQPLRKTWHRCIAAGRAAEGLREDWRVQLRRLQAEVRFDYIRFHGLLSDDMHVARHWGDALRYNFHNVFKLFDFLLEVGLRPFVELGFMPAALASGEATNFWWRANITPPKDYGAWSDLVAALVDACIQRYGREEVLRWPFEVWNEPDWRDFWLDGDFDSYVELYAASARAVKSVDARLQIGGPATSGVDVGGFTERFLACCRDRALPLDFVSSHVYPTDFPIGNISGKNMWNLFGPQGSEERLEQTLRATERTGYAHLPLHITEWNSTPDGRDAVHDTAFKGPFILRNNLRLRDRVASLAYWTFTDIIEEQGGDWRLFHGGFGLCTQTGVRKAAHHAYRFLAALGDQVLDEGDAHIVTRRGGGAQVLAWNYVHYTEAFAKGRELPGDPYDSFERQGPLTIELDLRKVRMREPGVAWICDRRNGSAYDVYQALGSPASIAPRFEPVLDAASNPRALVIPSGQDSWRVELEAHAMMLIDLPLT